MNADHSIKVQPRHRKRETENTGERKLNKKCKPIMNTQVRCNKFSTQCRVITIQLPPYTSTVRTYLKILYFSMYKESDC